MEQIKDMLQNEIKDLTFWGSLISPSLSFFKIISYEGPTFMTSTQKRGEEILKFVVCLWILLFLNNRSIVHFCELEVSAGVGGGVGGGVQSKKLVIFVDIIIV